MNPVNMYFMLITSQLLRSVDYIYGVSLVTHISCFILFFPTILQSRTKAFLFLFSMLSFANSLSVVSNPRFPCGAGQPGRPLSLDSASPAPSVVEEVLDS